MKVLVLFALVAMASAEPPRYRQRSAALTAPPAEPAEPAQAPYPPSGWKPSGRQFSLPARSAPQAAYSAPPQEKYGPPPSVYGPPPTTTEAPATTTEELPTTTDTATDNPQDNEFSGADAGATVAQADATRTGMGVYYVLLPDGRLQRVAYSTARNAEEFQRLRTPPQPINAGFLAVEYEDVRPIQAPVYAYGSPLVRLFK